MVQPVENVIVGGAQVRQHLTVFAHPSPRLDGGRLTGAGGKPAMTSGMAQALAYAQASSHTTVHARAAVSSRPAAATLGPLQGRHGAAGRAMAGRALA
ncbi:hypothetical protein [Comamonas serinivorans]|uniref:hypothetical protein n=1 Tax=Comamonas serinivorans TaxID=1082851 RepID=UPI0012FAB1B4|nr:hypothetical protein [Comamonas serinivorans]